MEKNATAPHPPADPAGLEDAVFHTAIHIEDPEQRRIFLERSFHGDPEGLERTKELLELVGESAAFFIETRKHSDMLAEAALDTLLEEPRKERKPPAPDDAPGAVIGRYRLIRRIGEGGCGVVHEAEQQEPVKRRVALKVIRLGMDTESFISRFEAERQALALMDHPNIARVLDAGATGIGRPYFVMELVEGERITSWCDKEKLDVAGVLALFIQVCHAIQHAHQKGIIHRDIKPSNVLITTQDGMPVPKVIDFGIAKATERGWSSTGISTALDQPLGTPAYMSPEQVEMAGIDIDTRGDVYGLGALLYELLAGRPPFDGEELMKAGMSEMRRILLEQDPPLPSVCLAEAGPAAAEIAARRRCDKARLISLLRGDLDWIVMKAMEKDRNHRYQTANSLAMDLQRYLANEPVIARRPGRLYLLGKFFRRNRATCISAAAVALSLLGGMSASTVLYWRERNALAQQERLSRETEAARAEEARLRAQAQARANVSHVAVLLSEGRIEEADALLQENPLSSIDPSLEAANVFRSIGNWNAIYGRWDQAVQCFTLLNQANRLATTKSVLEGLDLLFTAPAYLEHGDIGGYEAFRGEILDRYLPVQNSVEAEHLLKACLLIPADAAMLGRLEQVAEICAAGIPSSENIRFPAWEAFSLTMYHHRLGNAQKALEWSKKSRGFPDPAGSRVAGLLCLDSMSHQRLGNRKRALENFRKARDMIPAPLDPSEEAHAPQQGIWLSWSVARILLKEADAMLR